MRRTIAGRCDGTDAGRCARLVTLTGPGGAGKTRLALELARAIAAEGNRSRDVRTHWRRFGVLRSSRDDHPTLLVLDNFEHVLDAVAAAAVLKGDDAWAARILGARHAVTESTGATVVDKSVDGLKEQAEREVRARLGPERWALAYAAGRMTSIDSLLRDIDRVVGNG